MNEFFNYFLMIGEPLACKIYVIKIVIFPTSPTHKQIWDYPIYGVALLTIQYIFFWLNKKKGYSMWFYWSHIMWWQWIISHILHGLSWGYRSNHSFLGAGTKTLIIKLHLLMVDYTIYDMISHTYIYIYIYVFFHNT